MPENTFDIVSKVEMPEVVNAIQQAMKEISQRYDLKDTKSTIELNEKDLKINLKSSGDFQIKAVLDILQNKLVKRSVPLKNLEYGKIEGAGGSTVRQEITLQSGISTEKCREIVKFIKDSKKKVQASIQGDLVRVAGKDRDSLQEIIAALRGQDFGIDVQFTNYRSNLTVTRRIESFFIDGPVGRLEAILEEPEIGAPREAALVCHPHPLHGGTMHNKVVHRLARGLRKSGCVTLRFNFRGVNLSEGTHDEGTGEISDAEAAKAVLRSRYPNLPLTVSGFSFGSRVAVQCCSGARRAILAGFPTVYRQFEILERCPVTRIFIQSNNDEFGPASELQAWYGRLWGPKELHWIAARDHFFGGALDDLERVVRELGAA